VNLQQTLEAIKLHGTTNHHKSRVAAARGDGEEAARCHAIAIAAEQGRLLAPTAFESHMPDLVAAAQAHGLVDGVVVRNRGEQDHAAPIVKRVGDQPLAPELPPEH
jgi:hypothetical protein